MSEFVEEGLHFRECQQGRLFLGGFREVHHYADVRPHIDALAVDILSLVFRHPGAALLPFAGMEVGVEHGQEGTILVEHLVGLHVGMIHGNVLVLLEGDAIEAVGQSEDTVDDPRQLEIRSQHLGIDVVFLQLELVRIKPLVPLAHLEVLAFHFLGHVFQLFVFFDCRGLVGIDEVVEQVIYVLHLRGHAVLQHIVGKRAVAKQLCHLAAQVHQPLADVEVVLAVVVRADGVACHVELFTQVALGAVGHERRVGGEVEREHPSLQLALLGGHGCSLDGCLGQSVELFLVGDVEREGFVLLQQVLRELEREHRGLLGEFPQFFLSLFVEQCSATHESVVAVVEQHFLLGRQFAVMHVHILHALEKLLVQPYVVGMLGQYGLHLLSQGLHLVVGLGTEQVEEHRGDALQQVVVALFVVLVVDDGVVESRLLRVVDGLLYLLVVAPDAFHESLFIVFHAYAVEGHRVVRRAVFFEKWILT